MEINTFHIGGFFCFHFPSAIDSRDREIESNSISLNEGFHDRERERDKAGTTMLMRPYTSSKSL